MELKLEPILTSSSFFNPEPILFLWEFTRNLLNIIGSNQFQVYPLLVHIPNPNNVKVGVEF